MRILYVSRETPLHPSGGIATYLEYMVPAMRNAGHEVFLFSWSESQPFARPIDYAPFKEENVHIESVNAHEAWRVFPVHGHNLFISHWLADRIACKVREWDIDIIEATDFLAPCLTLFQQLQTRNGAERQLLSTYNHGLMEIVFEADQLRYPDWSVLNNLSERQQCRISDLVLAPSRAAELRLQSIGISSNVEVTREPYGFRCAECLSQVPRNEIQYIGRLSIQKGIDKIVHLANVLHPVFPLRRIELIGRIGGTPFRKSDMRAYVMDRIIPELRENVSFRDYVPRSVLVDLFEPGALAPHLGTDETFSYACIEAIDAGLVPIVRHGTAMAEFFPEHLQHYVVDGQMRSVRTLQRQMSAILENAAEVTSEVRAHCRETLDPGRIAEQVGRLYESRLERKRGRTLHAVPRKPATLKDLTVLIPAYKPNHEFMETVDSLAWQTAGIPKVLICDDGSPERFQAYFDYAHALLADCRIVQQPNSGLLAARNTLVEECETDLALFLDTDDLLAPELIEHLLEAWNACPFAPDAIIPQRRNFGESGELVLQHLLHDHMHLLRNDYRMTSLIRSDILRDIGFDATRRNGEGDDWAFWLEFTGRGYLGMLLPEQGFLYRFRSGSMSWPWSEGQHIGTQTMVREAVLGMCDRSPTNVVSLARALYARNATI